MTITITKRKGNQTIRATGKDAQALFDAMCQSVTKPAIKKSYVILIAPSHPRSYLAAESDEDDGEHTESPSRTANADYALIFSDFSTALAALRLAVKRYPKNEFQIDTISL